MTEGLVKAGRGGLSAWTHYLTRLKRWGKDIAREAKFSPENGLSDPRIMTLFLLVRTLSHTSVIPLLLKKKNIVEARILARNCLENLLHVGALAHEGSTFVDKMRDHDLKHKKMLGELLLKSVSEEERQNLPHLRKTLRQLHKEWPDVQTITPKSVAEIGAVFKSYLFYGQLSMDAAHPTSDSLSRHVIICPWVNLEETSFANVAAERNFVTATDAV